MMKTLLPPLGKSRSPSAPVATPCYIDSPSSISPGPMKLAALMDDDNYKNADDNARKRREQEIEMYSSFPMYPTGMSSHRTEPPEFC